MLSAVNLIIYSLTRTAIHTFIFPCKEVLGNVYFHASVVKKFINKYSKILVLGNIDGIFSRKLTWWYISV